MRVPELKMAKHEYQNVSVCGLSPLALAALELHEPNLTMMFSSMIHRASGKQEHLIICTKSHMINSYLISDLEIEHHLKCVLIYFTS